MLHGVPKAFVSSIVQNKRIPGSVLEEVNKKISFVCNENNFIFVDNSKISNIHLFDDGFKVKLCPSKKFVLFASTKAL